MTTDADPRFTSPHLDGGEPEALADGVPAGRRSIRWGRVLSSVAVVMVIGLIGILARTPSGYSRVVPGPVINLAHQITGPDLAPSLAHQHFYLTTVDSTPVSWWGYLTTKVTGHQSELLPNSGSPDSVSESTATTVAENALMEGSQAGGLHVAEERVFGHSGLQPNGAEIVLVNPGSPADTAGLEALEVITAVDGKPVTTVPALLAALDALPDGSTVELTVDRNGVISTVSFPNAGGAELGVQVATSYGGSTPYEVTVPGVGGPSGGLLISLASTAAMGGGDLAGNRVVAGTGTIEADGTVGPISGITQKVTGAEGVGATVFFAPTTEAGAAAAVAKPSMTVVPVGTYVEALEWLCRHGGTSSACQVRKA